MTRIGTKAKLAISLVGSQAGDLIWPRRSIISGTPSSGPLTPEDFAKLYFLGEPHCEQCATPQHLDLGKGAICPACRARPPRWTRARAPLRYDDMSRKPILALKRAGRRDGLDVMVNWMASAGRELLAEADLLVPVPLHYRRLVQRGFNQSGWLANGLARKTGLPVLHTALRRAKQTSTQEGLSVRARRENVRNAFAVNPKLMGRLHDRRILLVDDVLTTGATLNACTKVLLKTGARNVDVLVLARVVRETDISA